MAALLEAVAERDVVVAMIPAIGDFTPTDGRSFAPYGDADGEGDDQPGPTR